MFPIAQRRDCHSTFISKRSMDIASHSLHDHFLGEPAGAMGFFAFIHVLPRVGVAI